MTLAIPIESRGAPPDPRAQLWLSEPAQVEALLARYPAIRLWGELDGVLFDGEDLTPAQLARLQFWWTGGSHDPR